MNTTLRLLAEQAGFNLHNDPIDGHDNIHEIKKFAEILLFECIKIAVFKGDPATAVAIKEHFAL